MISGVLLDLAGVIYEGEKALPGARRQSRLEAFETVWQKWCAHPRCIEERSSEKTDDKLPRRWGRRRHKVETVCLECR